MQVRGETGAAANTQARATAGKEEVILVSEGLLSVSEGSEEEGTRDNGSRARGSIMSW